ncbi:MAG: indole-3-glycerol phosphate synthase TrpC [Syntrophales bacterium]|nr:indole-3-glycerol phosphate synthase TrpC [Syntrophales bacterium]
MARELEKEVLLLTYDLRRMTYDFFKKKRTMILEEIVEAKKGEVANLKRIRPLVELKEALRDTPCPRNFREAISSSDCSIIAEVKRRSPSKGTLREDFNPVKIAVIYKESGAAAISVLTEEKFFGGDSSYLLGIKKIVDLPLLRKDFIIDPYQIYETRVIGGDALLLIAGILKEEQLKDFIHLTESLGLSPLTEAHTREELDKALSAGADIIGINNRDLKNFSTDLKTSLELVLSIPGDKTVVSESGIHTRGDIEILMKAGIHCFLVGEALMRAHDMGAKLRELLGKGE